VILRVLTARVPSQNIGEFNELLRAQLSELREQPGLVYAKLARRIDEDQTEEVVLIEEWRTTADLFAWTGGRLNRPRLLRGTEELVDNLVIAHYEALDVSPEDLQQRVLGPDAMAVSRWDGKANADEDDAEPSWGAVDSDVSSRRTDEMDPRSASDEVRPPSGVLPR